MVTRHQHSAYASAVARHISAEGCQFVVEQVGVVQGQRFSFALDGHPAVRGTVRWVVKDRVGFAFDQPISRDAQAAMRERCHVVQGVELYLS
ncbi:PilZ domain-containing protein [Novosphingobium sp. FGD1]|uniref:PilZ domain-containing protein n=1 Tax=Novosphingobium silvae TaxID=2692619 RepID=A0A7X4K955_9SPHN|nr:PilZ domain-containing protein [Novosphingobium silvae]